MLSTAFFLVYLLVIVVTAATFPPQCGCGYQKPSTQQLSTDALIFYFNETDVIDPEIFIVEDYAREK